MYVKETETMHVKDFLVSNLIIEEITFENRRRIIHDFVLFQEQYSFLHDALVEGFKDIIPIFKGLL